MSIAWTAKEYLHGVQIGKESHHQIEITFTGQDLDASVDPRFGRAAYILIVDADTMAFEVVDNAENVNAFEGAGIQTASMISDDQAEVLLTGFCGPNAFKTLNAAGIQVVGDMSGTIRDALNAFTEGKIKVNNAPNVQVYW